MSTMVVEGEQARLYLFVVLDFATLRNEKIWPPLPTYIPLLLAEIVRQSAPVPLMGHKVPIIWLFLRCKVLESVPMLCP